MTDTMKYIFYGGVEGVLQNSGGEEDPGADYGAKAFGFAEGQLLAGHISFSDDAMDIINANLPTLPLAPIEMPIGTQGLDFFFPQPRVGDYTEADLIGIDDPIRNSVDVQFTTSRDDPLAHLAARAFDGADGPNFFIDGLGADMTDDDDAQARVDGIWLPEHILPVFISGTAGNDSLRGHGDYNFLAGGESNDLLQIKAGRGWVWGGEGNDTLKGGGKDDLLFGGYGNDRITAGSGNDLLKGGGGDDDLRGDKGNDILFGGHGNDTLKGGKGDDFLNGGSGGDQLSGGDGADYLDGGRGGDYLDGGRGDDFLFGGLGDDELRGGQGRDTYVFQPFDGDDTISGFQDGIDRVVITSTAPLSFDALIATAAVFEDSVRLTYGFEQTITFDNVSLSELQASNFILV